MGDQLASIRTRPVVTGGCGGAKRFRHRRLGGRWLALDPSHPHPGREPRPAFTLLEVLLTLLLTSLVLLAVAMAVDFQLRVVERSRRHVEEAQLARVVLHRIAADLRGAVPADPLKMQELLSEALSSAAASAGSTAAAAGDSAPGEADSGTSQGGSDQGGSNQGGSDQGGSNQGGSAQGGSGQSGSGQSSQSGSGSPSAGSGQFEMWGGEEAAEDADSSDTAGTAESSVPRSTPGVYGGADWLQVDVGRLPRLDQFENQVAMAQGSTTPDRLSDVKTVTYYVVAQEDAAAATADATASGTASTGGLVRRELDRAVASWSSSQGELDTSGSDVTPLAPEVASIAFRYSDGSQWLEEWDSSESGTLPVAIEITLSIRPFSQDTSTLSWGSATTAAPDAGTPEEENLLTYSLIVHLQAAEAGSSGGSGQTGQTSGQTESAAQMTDESSNESSPTGSGSGGEGTSR